MYALVKVRREQCLRRSMQMPIVLIDESHGIIANDFQVRNKLRDYPEIDYIEELFQIKLKGESIEEWGEVPEGSLLFYIGKGVENQEEWNVYDINKKRIKQPIKDVLRYTIDSDSNYLTSLQYLECILDMSCESQIKNKKLIIFTELEVKDVQYRYRSLMDKIANYLLETVEGISIHRCSGAIKDYYVPGNKRFEPYINQAIYTNDDLVKAMGKLKNITRNHTMYSMIKKEYRRLSGGKKQLYENVFYRQIRDEEEIYVPLLSNNNLLKETYEKVGLEYINLSGIQSILRGKKSVFDNHVELLNNRVVPQYMPQILTCPDIRTYEIPSYERVIPRKEQRYNGKGVYIGVVGVEGINYEENVYFTDTGEMKIAYMWEQIEGNEGNEYTRNQLLQLSQMDKNLPLFNNERLTTENMLFKTAGGKTPIGEEVYKGIATQAEFIIAKIKKASNNIQEIYGGIPNNKGILLEDLIIAVDKLVTFAMGKNVPLVLAIPFGAGVSSHDGLLLLEEKLGEYARQTGVTIVTSVGEEADKKHHTRATLTSDQPVGVELCIQKPNQKVIGGMWLDPFGEKKISLYNTNNQKQYSLDQQRQYKEGETEILTMGNKVNQYNGLREVIFSLKNPEVGSWKIMIQDALYKGDASIIDIWLAQYELNAYAFFETNDVFTTITSLGNIQGVICVGDYDNDTLTTYKTSGRGYTRQNLMKPTLVAQGKEVLEVDSQGKGRFVAGSLIAMANIVGVIAAVYSKALDEKIERMPSTLGIGSLLVSKVKQLDTVEYPNPSQGKGIFDRQSLDEILDLSKKINL